MFLGMERDRLAAWTGQPLRTFLFAPGSDERKIAKVPSFGSDVVVLDLEDAVADDAKDGARATVRAGVERYDEGFVALVRVNAASTGRLEADIDAVVCDRLDGILVPKADHAQELLHVDALLAAAEERAGLPVGAIKVVPIVETARGIVNVDDTLARGGDRLVTAIFGLGDFSTDIGVEVTPEGAELAYARARLIVATRAAGLAAPIDGPVFDIKNDELLLEDSRRSRGLGFQGRVIVFPPQVAPAKRAYSWLPDDTVAQLRDVVEQFEEAEQRNVASIRVNEQFVDYPIYERARRELSRYDAYARETERTA
jgi:citrate lyase subunit beta / citryl-CoA lyase